MLTLTRHSGESIYYATKVKPSTTIDELFGEDGHIAICIDNAEHNKVKLSIDAKREFAIARSELEDNS